MLAQQPPTGCWESNNVSLHQTQCGSDEYLGMLEDALGGTERREPVFTIRWAVIG